MDKKYYGLIIPKKAGKIQPISKSIFDSDSEDDAAHIHTKRKLPVQQSSKAKKGKIEDDPSIYEYDSIYDSMKDEKCQKKEKSVRKEPRFIQSLLKAADKRKKDHDRRLEKKIEIERIKEGDEFKDKESFVTSAYKQKMLEMEKEEEQQRLQNQLDDMMDVTKQKDLSGFYRHYLKQTVGEEKIPVFGDRDLNPVFQSGRNCQETKPSELMKMNSDPDDSGVLSDGEMGETINVHNVKQKVKSVHNRSRQISESSSNRDINNEEPSCNLDTKSLKHVDKKHNKYLSKDEICDLKHSTCKSEVETTSSCSNIKQTTTEQKREHDSHSSKDSSKGKSLKYSKAENSQSRASHHDSVNEDADDDDVTDNETEPEPSCVAETAKSETSKNPKSSMSVKFMKRTVGVVFDQAQARYFKRMAARGNG